jgi:hypothetical protein
VKKRQLSDLQDLFRVGAKIPPGKVFESKAKTTISITMPDGSVLHIETDEVTISFDRDFAEVTGWSDLRRIYKIDRGTFTIKGKL